MAKEKRRRAQEMERLKDELPGRIQQQNERATQIQIGLIFLAGIMQAALRIRSAWLQVVRVSKVINLL